MGIEIQVVVSELGRQMSAPETDDGKRRELIDAMLFFGAADNHLVMMQSASLRSDHLENHLQWLLHKAKSLEEGNSLRLIDQPPMAVREKINKSKVKELDIGGALSPARSVAPAGSVTVATVLPDKKSAEIPQVVAAVSQQAVSEQIDDGGVGIIEAIKRLLSPDQAAKLDFEKTAGANIEYSLKIRYKNSTTDDGQKLMNTLGSALRHAEGVDTKIKLHGGGEIKGEDLRLNGKVQITTYNGIPAPSEVFEAIRVWLLEKLKSGDIEAR